jgi:putative flavoprotein involved in K+ transport
MLEATVPGSKPGQWRIEGNATSENGVISSWFTFETAVSRGKGHIRLKDGKCWTLLTTMTELNGFEEKKGASRHKGVQHGAFPNRHTWLERKTQEAAELGVTKQPYCLIIGGGQGGIVLGARLKQCRWMRTAGSEWGGAGEVRGPGTELGGSVAILD